MALRAVPAAELAKHGSDKDCWIAIHGIVYDATNFLDEHPGGGEIIASSAGTNATEEFEEIGHSNQARDLKLYDTVTVVGVLEGSEDQVNGFRQKGWSEAQGIPSARLVRAAPTDGARSAFPIGSGSLIAFLGVATVAAAILVVRLRR
jgi:cytochrome b involved in lipid metabolism